MPAKAGIQKFMDSCFRRNDIKNKLRFELYQLLNVILLFTFNILYHNRRPIVSTIINIAIKDLLTGNGEVNNQEDVNAGDNEEKSQPFRFLEQITDFHPQNNRIDKTDDGDEKYDKRPERFTGHFND